MADKQEPVQQETAEPKEPTAEEVEEKFWKTHEEKTTGILDKWFEKKKEELRGMSTSRAGGRATLPGILANIMFGPEKKP